MVTCDIIEWIRNGETHKKILIALFVMISIVGCQDNKPKESTQQKDIVDLVQKQKSDSIAKANEALREENKKRLGVLKKNFKFKQDEFNNVGWYTHKYQTVENIWNRKCLKTRVSSTGYIYFESHYYADDWLFHTRIEVKIGDKIFKSEDVPTYSDDNRTENSGGSIWENVSYTGDNDNGIIKAIAESGDTPVKVRFIGKYYYDDFTLSSKDKQAIKDSYELSQLIKLWDL